MPDLLREALRSPRDLALMVGALLLAMLITSPLPTYLWGPPPSSWPPSPAPAS